MARFDVKAFTRDEWEAVASRADGFSLLQTWEYGEAKTHTEPWRVERGLIIDGDTTLAACQVLIRSLPVVGGGLVWINRGPVPIDDAQLTSAPTATKVLQAIRTHYVPDGRWYLRIALPLIGGDLNRSAVADAGFECTDTLGWASSCLNLDDDLAVLRQRLHGKWRNSLSKAERSEISISQGQSDQEFATFLREHRRMISENGPEFGIDPALIESLQANCPDVAKMTTFVATDADQVLGSILIARYGDTCEYLAGNTTDAGRRNCAGQLLLWSAIDHMKTLGLRRFDLGGMDAERTPSGIFQFKNRMGGASYRLSPELEAGGRGLIGRCVRHRVERARASN